MTSLQMKKGPAGPFFVEAKVYMPLTPAFAHCSS